MNLIAWVLVGWAMIVLGVVGPVSYRRYRYRRRLLAEVRDLDAPQLAHYLFRREMDQADYLPTREERLAAITAAYARYCDYIEAPLRELRRVIISL